MNKLWHEKTTNEKEDTVPVSVHTSWSMQGTKAKRSIPFNLLSKFTADSHLLERNLSKPKS
jgi:hypothetical protein